MSERASLVIKAAASAILRETFLCTSVEIFFGHCSSPWYAMDRSSKQAHWHENAPLSLPPSPRPRRLAEPALIGGPPWVRATAPTGRRPWRRGGARGKGRSRRRRAAPRSRPPTLPPVAAPGGAGARRRAAVGPDDAADRPWRRGEARGKG